MIKTAELPITTAHERWLALPESQRFWSFEAMEHAEKVFRGEVGGKRHHEAPYRASGTGKCMRYRHFQSEELIEASVVDTRLNNIFATGDFLHLKWQMMGLSAGWLIKAEVPVESRDGLLAGTMDGITAADSVFEFKSINKRGFSQVVTFGPLESHILQTHAYMYAGDYEKTSIVYEDKDSGDWREFLVNRDEEIIKKVKDELETLDLDYSNEILVEPLSDCQEKRGSLYRQCPFRDICLDIGSWKDMENYYGDTRKKAN